MVYLSPRLTDMLWELHTIINCQNDKVFGQANGTLKVFKSLPSLPGLRVAMETQVTKLGHFTALNTNPNNCSVMNGLRLQTQ